MHTESQNHPNFFIIGLPRSGTTLLEQMLDGHSQIAVCPEISSGMSFSRFGASKAIANHQQALLILNNFKQWASAFDDPIHQTLSALATSELSYPITSESFYRLLVNHYLAQKKALIFGEKTPENVFYLKTLISAVPDSKYLIIQRNPMDVLLSICESANIVQKQNIDLGFIMKFAPIVKIGLRELYVKNRLAGLDQCWIKYEDLVNRTEETLNTVCQFLGVPYEAEMLQFQYKKKFKEPNSPSQIIHQRLNQDIDQSRIDLYKTGFKDEHRSFLTAYLSPELSASPYLYSQTSLSPFHELLLRYSKLKYALGYYELLEFIKKMKSRWTYRLIYLFKSTWFEPFLIKNKKWSKNDWL